MRAEQTGAGCPRFVCATVELETVGLIYENVGVFYKTVLCRDTINV